MEDDQGIGERRGSKGEGEEGVNVSAERREREKVGKKEINITLNV